VNAGALIEAESVTRILPGPVPVCLVRDASLTIAAGEFVAVTGPSGSGKSSLLYLLGLLDRPTSGRIVLEGRDTATLDADEAAAFRLARLGFVFQFHFLLPEFTILENVLIPMRRLARRPEHLLRAGAQAILDSLGLGAFLNRRPDQLSGGERQRAAIARSVANDPVIVLADEPTGNLDSHNAILVFDILRRLAHEQGRAVVAVTHAAHLAAGADRQISISDGRIIADVRQIPAAGHPHLQE
jgi:lipoprotein-releasing system ATP-binding protein